ncbi:MAG: PIN domain-containing protein [Erysipelotrichaceae bacterium]|nr:PIN domain-containing protein [Erysipelotrichaceae bacterium]
MFFQKVPAYLIDTENVGSTWTSLLKNDDRIDLFIFVTANAKNLNYSLLREITENRRRNNIKIIDCEVGKNSLDFYLSSYLGYLIGKDRHSEYVIVSQDTGYDHIVEYWKKEGVQTRKINTKPEPEPKKPKVKKTKVLEEKKTSEKRIIKKKEETPIVKEVPSNPQLTRKAFLKTLLKDYSDAEIDDIFKTLANIPEDKREDKNLIYRTLVRRFKKNKGLAIYNLLKKELKKYYSLSDN